MRALVLGLSLAGLSACQDGGLDLSASTGTRIIVGPATPVAMDSLEGAPEEVGPRLSAALAAEAEARQISIVPGDKTPRFRLRGYMSASQTGEGALVVYVWDVFDQTKSRAQRITGSELVKRSAAEPWQAVDDSALRRVASRAMNDIAAFLVEQRQDATAANRPAAPSNRRASAE
jgi:hypothetical protein